MENLQTLTNLQELWLGRNRIKAVNLCGLTCIRKLSLQSNRLTSMAGLQVREIFFCSAGTYCVKQTDIILLSS